MSIEITIPRLGWSMEEGTFAGWMKRDGDAVRQGDALFELEGEKAVQEIEALDDGVLQIPLDGPQPGAVLKVGAVIGYLVVEGETLSRTVVPAVPAIQSPPETNSASARVADSDIGASPSVRRLARELKVSLTQVIGTGAQGRITDDDVRAVAERTVSIEDRSSYVATPRARRAAKRTGMDLGTLKGTGRNGRIRECDVIEAAGANSAAPEGSQAQRIVLSKRRKVIAERLSESHRQTVPVTLTAQADATNLVSLREQFKSTGETPVPAFHDIIAKLVAGCLRQERQLAGRWERDSIVLPGDDEIHIGLAVDTAEGLIVPVLRNVLNESLLSVTADSSRVVRKAREGRLSGAEMQDAVFTITNLGSFGIDAFTPVINFPETAILGLGTIRKQAVVVKDDRIEARQIMTLSLTFDHRAIDGAPAARFLHSVVSAVQNPAARLLQAE